MTMHAQELKSLPPDAWEEVQAGEHQPWGGLGEELRWADKQRHIGIHDEDGRLLALAGLTVVQVQAGAEPAFPVVGLGGVIVTRSRRGEGLTRPLLEETMRLAGEVGPERAMLFCDTGLRGLYGRHGFAEIAAAVIADQPDGPVQMPLLAMWAPLAVGVGWPPGDVRVLGLPF